MPSPRVPAALSPDPAPAWLTQFPAVCFTLTLMTDLAFWRSSNVIWHMASAWLLLVGLIGGGLAVLAALVNLVRRRGWGPAGWMPALGGVVVLLLAVLNSFVHARDGWTAVVPQGLALSGVTVLLMILLAASRRALLARAATGAPLHA